MALFSHNFAIICNNMERNIDQFFHARTHAQTNEQVNKKGNLEMFFIVFFIFSKKKKRGAGLENFL